MRRRSRAKARHLRALPCGPWTKTSTAAFAFFAATSWRTASVTVRIWVPGSSWCGRPPVEGVALGGDVAVAGLAVAAAVAEDEEGAGVGGVL